MTEIIFHWDGTLDKFVGDEIVAFWGAPLPQENHAELAVKCGLHMAKRLRELQQKWESEGKPPLDSGIGINTGEVLVGNIGAEGKKMDYTVIGDHVNLGARVEGLTRKYDARILITEFTLARIIEAFRNGSIYQLRIEGLDKVIVKGREKPVGIYKIEEGEESVFRECKEDRVSTLTEK
jgi:adenylate cyclase